MLTKIHKGKSFTKTKYAPMRGQKVITFDLDETLGAFGELYLIWLALNPTTNVQMVFRELLDLYPEFLRPGIFPILEYLLYKKKTGECSHIFLYTNNQCSPPWVDYILTYFDERLNTVNLFDKAVKAFKINNQIVEPLRTSHSKSYSDLIRCTLIPKNSELCFIDNTYHPKMDHDRVYYIKPKTYEHGLSSKEIIDRFLSKWTATPLPLGFEQELRSFFAKNEPNKSSQRDAILVSQKIMYHLKEYFLLSTKKPKTKKISFGLGRFTRKSKRV